MTSRWLGLTLILTPMIGVTSPLRADPTTYREWVSHCTTGSFQACFSLQVLFVHQFSATLNSYTTDVEIRVANLQGRAAWLPNPGPFAISFLDFSGLETDMPSAPFGASTATLGGGAVRLPGDLGHGGMAPEYFGSGGTGFLEAIDANVLEEDIVGCDVDAQHASRGALQTCKGWVDLSFTLPGTWSFGDGTVASLTFRGAPACDNLDACSVEVTPEPVTLLLFGTGLTGLAGLALVRRRRVAG